MRMNRRNCARESNGRDNGERGQAGRVKGTSCTWP